MLTDKGQSLIELVIVISIGAVVVGALVFATISSLRNAQFAKNQAQATKLAQEGLEKVRSLRDRNIPTSIQYPGLTDARFSDLWGIDFSCSVPQSCPTAPSTCPSGNCYFYFNASNSELRNATPVNFEEISDSYFKRQFFIEDYVDGTQQKKVTSVVTWTDFSGPHESRLTTILRRI